MGKPGGCWQANLKEGDGDEIIPIMYFDTTLQWSTTRRLSQMDFFFSPLADIGDLIT